MLISDFMVNSMLKIPLKIFLCNVWNILTRMQRRKKGGFCTLPGGINCYHTVSATLLDIMHKSYGFGVDLIETIS